VEARRLGPAALPGTWGRLLEEVAGAAPWLEASGLEPDAAAAEARSAAARRLLRARDAAARVLAAVARAEGPPAAAEQEAAIAARAYGVPVEDADVFPWRAEPDPLLRAAEALRAELLAGQAEERLAREAGGPEWWRARAAGALLRAAWAEGARRSPEELSRALGAAALDAGALDRVVRQRARL
jgi:hypothetical protein